MKRLNSSAVSISWANILRVLKISESTASVNVLQHILQHCWSTIGSTVEKKDVEPHLLQSRKPDDLELMAIREHAGWAVKRARDNIKAGTEGGLKIQKSPQDTSNCDINQAHPLALISKLGKDEKQEDGLFRFIPIDEVVVFFTYLHDIVDKLLSKDQICCEGSKVVNRCLEHPSRDQILRRKWFCLVARFGFEKPVEVFVLMNICTMFVKSKQQIVREKLSLKPQNKSISLREGRKTKVRKAGKGALVRESRVPEIM